jgi:hypothetical protein
MQTTNTLRAHVVGRRQTRYDACAVTSFEAALKELFQFAVVAVIFARLFHILS